MLKSPEYDEGEKAEKRSTPSKITDPIASASPVSDLKNKLQISNPELGHKFRDNQINNKKNK